MKVDKNLLPSYYSKLPNVVTDYIIEKEIPIEIQYLNNEWEEVYLKRVVNDFKYLFYNPETKRKYLQQKSNIVRFKIDKDLGKIVKKIYFKRVIDGHDGDKEKAIESLQRTSEKLLKGGEKEMSNYYHKNLDNNILNYVIKNEMPVKIHYTNDSIDEGVYIKMYGKYNYLIYDPDTQLSIFANKANVVKIEMMGKLNDAI